MEKPHLHIKKEPVEVDQASDQDASTAPPRWGIPGMSHWDNTQRQTEDTLERFYLLDGLVTP